MAKRIFQAVNWTPTATADTTAHANATYMALKGGSATQRLDILEILVSGLAPSVSSPTILQFARTSTANATTPTALAAPSSEGPFDPATALLGAVPIPFTAAAAGPQRSAIITDARLNVGLNAYGGILKWFAFDRSSAWGMLGATFGFGENVLSAFTGGTPGAVSAHIIYEPA
jgi:hypothetical protein